MKLKVKFLILLCSLSCNINAQKVLNISLNIGDTIPPLKIGQWIKGPSIQNFEKDKIYVLEFWASWCVPCLASLPRLSELSLKYRNKVNMLAIDVYEKENTPSGDITKLIEGMGNRINYPVGMDKGYFMVKNWIEASESRSIPKAFIVKNGKLDWIGHPQYLDSILMQILNGTWRSELALLKRNNQIYLRSLEFAASKELVDRVYLYKVNMANNSYDRMLISPDSVILQIDQMVKQLPSLKFLPVFFAFTFTALLETDKEKAFKYVQEAMLTTTYEDYPDFEGIISQILENSVNVEIPANIYRVGARCCQILINQDSYPELGNVSENYKRMATFYKMAGDLQLSLEADRKSNNIQ